MYSDGFLEFLSLCGVSPVAPFVFPSAMINARVEENAPTAIGEGMFLQMEIVL